MKKYIFVTGGVASSLGKGIISSSLAKLLQARGFSVTNQKFDPYINVNPGLLNPHEHGECYVTNDGAETDLDLGHYERFTNEPTSQANSVTTGRIYRHVIESERRGEYLGKTVQVVPHITNEIKRRIQQLGAKNYDIIITEIGGTVGDIESLPYIEAMRQLRWELGPGNSLSIHLTLVPYLSAAGEIKTKPTQHSVKTLQEYGVQPDVLVLRTERHIAQDVRKKVALFCNVDSDAVVESIDVSTIYEVPLLMHSEKLDEIAIRKLNLSPKNEPDLSDWKNFIDRLKNPKQTLEVALVGKYPELPDAYKSIIESFVHAGSVNECKVKVKCISAEKLNADNAAELLGKANGIVVAPGFGQRGFEGKMVAAKYARKNNIPFLGIGLGMQAAVVEFARDVLGYVDANSTEMNSTTKYPVIDIMENEKRRCELRDGTMRLGAYPSDITENTLAHKVYGKTEIRERHRHRYELNSAYINDLLKAGMVVSAINPNSELGDIIEIPSHKWFMGVSFHPEYQSTVASPHPLFVSFVEACAQGEKTN